MPAFHVAPSRPDDADGANRDSRYVDVPLRRLNWPRAELLIEDAVSRRFVAMGEGARALLELPAAEVRGLEQWRIVYPPDRAAVERLEALVTPPDPDRRLLGLRLTCRVRLQTRSGRAIGARIQAVRVKTRHGLRNVIRIASVLRPEQAIAAEHPPRWRMGVTLDRDVAERVTALATQCQLPVDDVVLALLAGALRHDV